MNSASGRRDVLRLYNIFLILMMKRIITGGMIVTLMIVWSCAKRQDKTEVYIVFDSTGSMYYSDSIEKTME